MSIIFSGQAKVSDIFRLVHRLLHGAQRYRSDEPFLRLTCHCLHSLLNFLGLCFLAYLELHIKISQKLGQILHFFLCRNIMHTINKGPMLLEHMLSHCFVGCQHKFLDNGLRITMNALHNLNRMQFFVQNHLLLRQVEIYRATTSTLIVQNLA